MGEKSNGKQPKKEKKDQGEISEPSDSDWPSCKTEGAEAKELKLKKINVRKIRTKGVRIRTTIYIEHKGTISIDRQQFL